MLATGLSAFVTYQSVAGAKADRFRLQTLRAAEEVGDVMATYFHILRAGAGLFDAADGVTDQKWRRFVAKLDLEKNNPGVQGLGFAEVVPAARAGKRLVDPSGSASKVSASVGHSRDIKTSIVYIEPRDWRNTIALGYDMYSEPVRRAAMEDALNANAPRMTRSVTLLQEEQSAGQKGVLVYVPIFSRDAPLDTLEQRAAGLTGFVYAAFRMQDMFDSAIRQQIPALLQTISVQLLDGPSSQGGSLLFDSLGAATRSAEAQVARPDLTMARMVTHAGQSWELQFAVRPNYTTPMERWLPWFVVAGGTVISLLITGIAGAMATARMREMETMRALEHEVTVRKSAQQALQQANHEVRISNQELVHRVKNMMAVVSSIATQTARYTPDPDDFNTVFRERLAALGRVHDFLKPNPVFRPDLKSLLPEILAPYIHSTREALHLNGPSVEISQSTAVMLSLVVNELAANSVRHGAWSRASGSVDFAWQIGNDASDVPSVVFQWRERGGPTVTVSPKRGFGSNVLTFSIERVLRGKIERRFPPSGFECDWSIPLRHGEQEGPTREF